MFFVDYMLCVFGQVVVYVFYVGFVIFQWNDQIDYWLVYDFIVVIFENLFGGVVEFDNFVSFIDNDYCVEG